MNAAAFLTVAPDVPVTTMFDVPTGVEPEVVIVIVVVQVGLHDAGENDAVAPDGKPDAEKVTAAVEPDIRVELTA